MSQPVRRFYKAARVADDGAGVMLDERRLRTPKGAPFAAPTRALAEAIAAEWNGQGEHILPASMPLTQLAFAAIDHTPARRDDLHGYVAKFGETDLVAHRAAAPAPLVSRQSAHWDPLVAWGERALGVSLPVVIGVSPARTHAAAIGALRAHAAALDDFQLTALAQATGLAGSALIAFALLRGERDAAQAFEAALLDELYQLETWGEDAEGRARVERARADFAALEAFLRALEQ
jgi:chaperone required for assembly of F1-ATPase